MLHVKQKKHTTATRKPRANNPEPGTQHTLKRYFGKEGEGERGKEKKEMLFPKLLAAAFRLAQEGCKIPPGK